MIKIYSNQTNLDVIASVTEIATNEFDWWMIYDMNTSQVIISPLQCSGFTSSPHTMVIADTEEELYQYIQDNNLILPLDPDYFPTYNIE